jgi:hypothetical protein
MSPLEVVRALRGLADDVAAGIDARNAEVALGLPPASPELQQAGVTFRASGGTAEQLDVLSRMVARGRLEVTDLSALEAAGIKMPHPID